MHCYARCFELFKSSPLALKDAVKFTDQSGRNLLEHYFASKVMEPGAATYSSLTVSHIFILTERNKTLHPPFLYRSYEILVRTLRPNTSSEQFVRNQNNEMTVARWLTSKFPLQCCFQKTLPSSLSITFIHSCLRMNKMSNVLLWMQNFGKHSWWTAVGGGIGHAKIKVIGRVEEVNICVVVIQGDPHHG